MALHDERGEFDLQFRGYAKAGATLRLIGDRRADGGMRVAEKDGAPGADVIEQSIAVGIVKVLAASLFDDERLAANRAEGTDGAVDAADEDLLGLLKDFLRAAAVRYGAAYALHSCAHLGVQDFNQRAASLAW